MFQRLKQYLATPPILSKPNTSERIYVYFPVSDSVVSGVLIREDNKVQKPVYFISKSLLDAKTRYPKMEKLIIALIITSKKLEHHYESENLL